MRVAFVTVGDTGRKTGGYLYNARVLAGLREAGVEVVEVVAGGASPKEQLASASRVGPVLNPPSFDVILVDALARIAVAPHLDRWRASRPVVALVHELPSVAGGEPAAGDAAVQRAYEEPLLRADRLVAVSEHGRALLGARGVQPERVSVVPPGFDRLATPAKTSPVRSAGPVRALCVAQWIPRKGILTLIEAWTRRPRPGAVLELVGETDADPVYAASVRETIASAPPGFDRLATPAKTPPVRSAGPVRALCVAQWIPRKGILTLIEAWARQPRPGAVLELVGETDADPVYAASVRETIASAPVGSVLVSGPVDDAALVAAYAAADLFVLPSRYEGYGMVFAEALSFGLPVLACEVGPVPRLVGPDAALLVPPDAAEALSDALGILLGDSGLRGRMSAAARRRAAELPSWGDAVAGLHEALRDAVSRSGVSLAEAPPAHPTERSFREQNRRSWNAVVGAHASHRGELAGFLRAGGTTLFPEERELLGDLAGETLAHLLCNTGGDSLSLSALGAAVVGVDLSDEAVRSARTLSERAGIPARFEQADVYDWLADAAGRGRRFDAVFSSYGVVCWLPDLGRWASGIAAVLEPGGRFVLVDFHPAAEMFDEGWRHARDYPSGGEPLRLDEGVGDYVGESGGGLTPAGFSEGVRGFENPEPCHLFRWGLGEVVTAFAEAGLRISALREYPYSNGERHFSGMRQLPGRRLAPPEGVPAVPLMYGLKAEKPLADTRSPKPARYAKKKASAAMR